MSPGSAGVVDDVLSDVDRGRRSSPGYPGDISVAGGPGWEAAMLRRRVAEVLGDGSGSTAAFVAVLMVKMENV